MKQLVEFDLPDGGTVLLESDVPEGTPGAVRASRSGVEKASKSFQSALDSVQPAINTLMSRLGDINNPAEINVEFGLNVSAKAGFIIASADSEVTFKVSLTWDNTSQAGEAKIEGGEA